MKLPTKCQLCINPEKNIRQGKCNIQVCKNKQQYGKMEYPNWMKPKNVL